MIVFYVNAAGVEKVVFKPRSSIEFDFDRAAWTLIQHHVDRMNLDLKEAANHVIAESRKEGTGKQG